MFRAENSYGGFRISTRARMRDQLKRAFYFEEGPMYAQQCAHTHTFKLCLKENRPKKVEKQGDFLAAALYSMQTLNSARIP